ncbi:MAG: hypothetical protein IJ247_03640 [Bacilli bacterium]|nr:hypothetical protein [Bacilli bacterium]
MRKTLSCTLFGFLVLSSAGVAASFVSKSVVATKAEEAVSTKLSLRTPASTGGIYLASDVDNGIPYVNTEAQPWYTRFYTDEASAVIVNGEEKGNLSGMNICKHSSVDYYLALQDAGLATRSEGEIVTLQGTWTTTLGGDGLAYSMTIEPISFRWDGTKWVDYIDVDNLDLEAYDTFSLAQIGCDDFDGVAINTEAYEGPNSFNSFPTSADNSTNSFVFKFNFESYKESPTGAPLTIRVGTSRWWGLGHFYQFSLWTQYNCFTIDEVSAETDATSQSLWKSGDQVFHYNVGERYLFEFGAIALRNSDKTYIYAKVDGVLMFNALKDKYSDEGFTNRVGIYYGVANEIFLGNAIDQDMSTELHLGTDGNGGDHRGIYLTTGVADDMPFDSANWTLRSASATTTNILYNGKPAITSKSVTPLVKYDENKYYIALTECGAREPIEGDILTIRGEFHQYYQGRTYSIGFKEFHALFDGTYWNEITSLSQYLGDELASSYDPTLYDDDKLVILQGIVNAARTDLGNATSSDAMWTIYEQAKDDILEVPLNEEKAREKLEEARLAAKEVVNNYADLTNYTEEDADTISSLIQTALSDLDNAQSVEAFNSIVDTFKNAVDQIETLLVKIEKRILNHEEGYRQYLAYHDVVTTSDLSQTGVLTFTRLPNTEKGEVPTTFGNLSDPLDTYRSTVAVSKENTTNSLAFQFVYNSTDPLSNGYGAQIFLRMRGTAQTSNMFYIADKVGESAYVSYANFASDRKIEETYVKGSTALLANTNYTIQCGSIDLKGYSRVYNYVMVNGNIEAETITDSVLPTAANRIIFCDCYTGKDTSNIATLSPVDEGTTKRDFSTPVGGAILIEEQNERALPFTLRKNSIPVNATLYPAEQNAVLVNGSPLPAGENPILVKVSETRYELRLVACGVALDNGLSVVIDGCFQYFDDTTKTKTIFKMSTSSFVYDSSSKTWKQGEIDLDTLKENALDYVRNYTDSSAYDAENLAKIASIVSEFESALDGINSKEALEALVDRTIAKLDAVPTKLDAYKQSAKNELASYKDKALYRDAEKARIEAILADAYSKIDGADSETLIDVFVSQAKASLDLLKTDAQYLAEELERAKARAKEEVADYVELLDVDRYSDANYQALHNKIIQVRADIDAATSIEEVNRLVSAFKEEVKAIKTNDGSTFDGEKYVEGEAGGNRGCGGAIASSLVVSALALAGISAFALKRRKEEK